MSQLTKNAVLDNTTLTENSVEIRLPLPPTPLKTQQWVNEFSALFGFTQSEPDWGADRYQVVLNAQTDDASLRCILCVEWLCEAIWLEPIGTHNDPHLLLRYLHQA